MPMKRSSSFQLIGSILLGLSLLIPADADGRLRIFEIGFLIGPALMVFGKVLDLRAVVAQPGEFRRLILNWCLLPGVVVASAAVFVKPAPTLMANVFFAIVVGLGVAYVALTAHGVWRRG